MTLGVCFILYVYDGSSQAYQYYSYSIFKKQLKPHIMTEIEFAEKLIQKHHKLLTANKNKDEKFKDKYVKRAIKHAVITIEILLSKEIERKNADLLSYYNKVHQLLIEGDFK